MGTAEWLFLTLLRSVYFLHAFHNARRMAPIHQVTEGFALRDFMERSRTTGSSGALLSACVTLVGGKSQGCAICLFESICGYMENTCKNTKCHRFTWFCIIWGKRKHKERVAGSDCCWGKLDTGQEEKVQGKERKQSRAVCRPREERNTNINEWKEKIYATTVSWLCLPLNLVSSSTSLLGTRHSCETQASLSRCLGLTWPEKCV